MEEDEIAEVIATAIARFYAQDHDLVIRNAGERALTDRIARYIEDQVQGYAVTVEYDRHGVDPKAIDLPDRDDVLTRKRMSTIWRSCRRSRTRWGTASPSSCGFRSALPRIRRNVGSSGSETHSLKCSFVEMWVYRRGPRFLQKAMKCASASFTGIAFSSTQERQSASRA